jgi:hypothetical protein
MNCEERSGFLFAHGCDRAATVSCDACGKHVCALHLRGEGGTPLCVSCARTQSAESAEDDPHRYGERHGASYYDSEDRSAFRAGRLGAFAASSRSPESDADGT